MAPQTPLLDQVKLDQYVSDDVGLPTLRDILAELRKPGRDPRATFEAPAFRDDVTELKDLKPGMVLEGVVTNIVAFGAFVDVGVHQDGLVHVSQLADRYVADPNDVVKVGQRVKQGEKIGTVGATGRATGAHLDWRVNWFDVRLDPQRLLPPQP